MKWAVLSITPAQIVLLRVLFGFLPLLAFALATQSLRWRDWRHAHHFLAMAVLATAFYYAPSPRARRCSCRAWQEC
jgi:hypothetical protein